jgi:hydrogenase-4 component E
MLAAHLNPLVSSVFSLIAIASLLLAFVMLGSRWLRHYLYAFAVQSWLIGILSAIVGFYGGYPELYLIAILTCLFRGCVLPYLILRIIRRMNVPRWHCRSAGADGDAIYEADRVPDADCAP